MEGMNGGFYHNPTNGLTLNSTIPVDINYATSRICAEVEYVVLVEIVPPPYVTSVRFMDCFYLQ